MRSDEIIEETQFILKVTVRHVIVDHVLTLRGCMAAAQIEQLSNQSLNHKKRGLRMRYVSLHVLDPGR